VKEHAAAEGGVPPLTISNRELSMQKITPFLWYATDADEAARF
jgi:hypothetical protein